MYRIGAAAEVLGNVAAMEAALDSGSAGAPIGVSDLLDVDARLMHPSRHPEFGGKLREVQNWIGRTTPLHADFVPPPPENVPALVDDLVAYTNLEHHSPLLQAGIAHAQFETIHPFVGCSAGEVSPRSSCPLSASRYLGDRKHTSPVSPPTGIWVLRTARPGIEPPASGSTCSREQLSTHAGSPPDTGQPSMPWKPICGAGSAPSGEAPLSTR